MKEDEEEEQIIKKDPVLNRDELGKNSNKKKKILIFQFIILFNYNNNCNIFNNIFNLWKFG